MYYQKGFISINNLKKIIMVKTTKKTTREKASDELSDAKATRLKKIKEGNKKTSKVREDNSKTLYGERHVR